MYMFSKHLAPIVFASVIMVPSVFADWEINAGTSSTAGQPQDIVVSLKLNPKSHPEAACLSITIARNLRGDFSPPGAPPTEANVTLFPTLDGVALGDDKVVSSPRFECVTPEGFLTLAENLDAFIDGNPANMVICPICWSERYGTALPDYGVLNPPAVNRILLNAEKIIDF